MTDIKRKPVKDKISATENIKCEKPFRQRKDGDKRLIQTEDDVVESELTFPKKASGDRFKEIKSFLNKK